MKTDTRSELLDRHRDFAAGGEDLFRSGQAQRHSARAAGRGSALPRASRSAQDSRRRQGDGEEPARARHPAHRRSGRARRRRSSKRASANGGWRWPARRRASMRAAGSMPKSASAATRNRSATSTRSTTTRATRSSSKPRWRILPKRSARRLREHGLHARTIQLKLRYSDFSTITRAHYFRLARRNSISI